MLAKRTEEEHIIICKIPIDLGPKQRQDTGKQFSTADHAVL